MALPSGRRRPRGEGEDESIEKRYPNSSAPEDLSLPLTRGGKKRGGGERKTKAWS